MFSPHDKRVHYKVFLKNDDGSNIEIRRFDSPELHYLVFESLCEKLKGIFPELRDKNFTVSWIDEEDDEIKITSTEGLGTALEIATKKYSRITEPSLLNRPSIKLHVKLNQKDKNARFFQKEAIIHGNVICDGCDNAISGFRYKCVTCEDYDLCSQCEILGLHAEHCMLRMLQPLNWSTYSGKRLLDHIKKFLRRKGLGYCNRESSGHETRKEKQPEGNVAAASENIVEESPKKGHETRKEKQPEGNVAAASENIVEESPRRNTKLIDLTVIEPPPLSDNTFVSHSNITSAVNPLMEEWTILDKNDISCASSVSSNLDDSSENNLATVSANTTATTSAAISVATSVATPTATSMTTPMATSVTTSATTSATISTATSVFTSVITPVTTSVSTSATTAATAPMRNSPLPIYPQLPKESRIHHPNPRIHNALLALITMGYSNNGGVLTHLLETENGDINKVIDILEYGKR